MSISNACMIISTRAHRYCKRDAGNCKCECHSLVSRSNYEKYGKKLPWRKVKRLG